MNNNYMKVTEYRAQGAKGIDWTCFVFFNDKSQASTRDAWTKVLSRASGNVKKVSVHRETPHAGPWSNAALVGGSMFMYLINGEGKAA